MRGILLAGGAGTRLHPLTKVVSKQLLAVFDKPLAYYPLSTLMLAGIRDILIITTPNDEQVFRRLLGTGIQWGCNFEYAAQPEPKGLAQAFLIGEQFIGNEPCCLILGDNLFYGNGLVEMLQEGASLTEGAMCFGYRVNNPSDYGVVDVADNGTVISIEEKPEEPMSNYAIPGIYFCDSTVVDMASNLKPSSRGELEVTDILKSYMYLTKLKVRLWGRGMAWLDCGTPNSLLEAGNFVRAIESRMGMRIGDPEEAAKSNGWI